MRATALTLLLGLTLVSGCSKAPIDTAPPLPDGVALAARVGGILTTDEVLAILTARFGHPSLLIVDARTNAEWASEHIPGAANITYDMGNPAADRMFENAMRHIPRSTNVIIYSNSGTRSAAARSALGLGLPLADASDVEFTAAWDMADGLDVWKARGYPTIK
ncbi:MAG: rhodanese-like domain-containing protein [Planctomycetota bacterium]